MRALTDTLTLDEEWIALLEEAKEMGLSLEEVEAFIKDAEQKG
ncbi:anti-repressor SinI family protein [Halobacillus salinarum]|uniref:Anti-repressor SinI family protein n=1 Tax=Halobacillus salinarum TaxID=2932257 RepID=A0ABY4ENX0_9BACI|nr:anti-repressor SinI family protein [Halobacillus salinarum]UOQ45680.1 anti-repressor SinI family protein [Halobacillus salinarum]